MVFGYFKVGLTFELHFPLSAREALREFEYALSIEPYLGAVGQRQMTFLATRRLDSHYLVIHVVLWVSCLVKRHTVLGEWSCFAVGRHGDAVGRLLLIRDDLS